MKKTLFFIFAVSILFIGCSKDSAVSPNSENSATVTKSETSAAVTKSETSATVTKSETSVINKSYDYAKGIVKEIAQKNKVMVDAFELRNAKELYISPAQVMNGWKSFIWLEFRFAVKGVQDSEWVDIPKYFHYSRGEGQQTYTEDYSFVIGDSKGEYRLVNSEPKLDEIENYFTEKGK